MILINPKGKEKDFDEARANKILNNPSKRKQGWVSKDEIEAIETERRKKIHLERVELIGDLSEYIEGFSEIDFSNYEDKGFDDLLENAKRIKIKLVEEKRLKEEQEKADKEAEEKRLKEEQEKIKSDNAKEEAKKKRITNLKNQPKPNNK